MKRFEQCGRSSDRAIVAADQAKHVQRRFVLRHVEGCATVFEEQAFVTAIVGVAEGRLHTVVGGNAGDHKVSDSLAAQDLVEIARVKAADSGLVDHRLAGPRGKLGNDLAAGLVAHQDATVFAFVADAKPEGGGCAIAGSDSGLTDPGGSLRACTGWKILHRASRRVRGPAA